MKLLLIVIVSITLISVAFRIIANESSISGVSIDHAGTSDSPGVHVAGSDEAILENPYPTNFALAPPPVEQVDPPGVCTRKVALVLIAHDREEYLRECLRSLSSVRELSQVCIIVSMDAPSHYAAIRAVISEFPDIHARTTFIEQSTGNLRKFKHTDFAITWHHGRIFVSLFDDLKFEYGILLETDLTVSPDFIEYMLAGRNMLVDSSSDLFCISAWNDNGFNGFSLRENRLYRTDVFPGLGWMLHRDSWTELLRSKWPQEASYDWWIRNESPVKHFDCVFPEVSRTHHIAKYGAHVNGGAQQVYERMILSSGQESIPKEEWALVSKRHSFEPRIIAEAFAEGYVLLRGLSRTDLFKAIEDSQRTHPLILVVDPKYMQAMLARMGLFALDLMRAGYNGLLTVRRSASEPPITLVDEPRFVKFWESLLNSH
jgi:hypothetical protein